MADEKNYPISVQPTSDMLAEIQAIKAALEKLSPIKGKITTTDVLRYAVAYTAAALAAAESEGAQ